MPAKRSCRDGSHQPGPAPHSRSRPDAQWKARPEEAARLGPERLLLRCDLGSPQPGPREDATPYSAQYSAQARTHLSR